MINLLNLKRIIVIMFQKRIQILKTMIIPKKKKKKKILLKSQTHIFKKIIKIPPLQKMIIISTLPKRKTTKVWISINLISIIQILIII
jgi:hypothetical protein